MRKLTARAQPFHLPGYPDYLAALLHARGIQSAGEAERFLNPALHQLHSPFLLHGMQRAADLIRDAKSKGQSIVVYGDYDADGICASAILLGALRDLGANAFSYIPDRAGEGYGLNAEAVRQLSGQAGLLITVDCGITALEETALAASLSMRVILTDHHSLPEILPGADAVVHPLLADYPDPQLCGSGVAWKLACALLGEDKVLDGLELAAIATIADMVPLTGENRVIAALGLERLRDTKSPGLRALMRAAGMRAGEPVQSDQVAFQLAPRLNAAGRLATARGALRLLLTRDTEEADDIAGQMDLLNRERREIENKVLREAAAQLQGKDFSSLRSLVIAGEDWNPGVVGLAAGKLAERWNYPAVVLTGNGDELSGSGRSAGGIDLYAALKRCSDLFTRFGGHRMAAGLSLPVENLQAFTDRFDAAVREQLGEGDLIPETVYDCALPLSQVTLDMVQTVGKMAPFGMGNPPPLFLLEDLNLLNARTVGSGNAHLKLTVAGNGAVREGIAFNQGDQQAKLSRALRLVAGVERNDFIGRVNVQLQVKTILPGPDVVPAGVETEAGAILRELARQAPESRIKPRVLDISRLPELAGSRGTLLIARCAQTVGALRREYPALQALTGNAPDPRGFHAIVYMPDWSLTFARYERVVLADGLLGGPEAAMVQNAAGAEEILVMPKSAAFSSLIDRLRLSVSDLRQAYVLLRDGAVSGLCGDPVRDLAAKMVLHQLDLISLDERFTFTGMKQSRRISPKESALFMALQ